MFPGNSAYRGYLKNLEYTANSNCFRGTGLSLDTILDKNRKNLNFMEKHRVGADIFTIEIPAFTRLGVSFGSSCDIIHHVKIFLFIVIEEISSHSQPTFPFTFKVERYKFQMSWVQNMSYFLCLGVEIGISSPSFRVRCDRPCSNGALSPRALCNLIR